MSWNPLKVAFPSGPNCEGCPFRQTSIGFAVTQGYSFQYNEGTWLKYEPGALFASADYMLIAESLGKDEARQGRNMVGGTGGRLNYLIHNHTPLKRPEVVIANVVKCRPIKWMVKDGKKIPIRQGNGDFVNDTPADPAQVKECYERYGKEELEAFQGHTIMLLGASSLALFAGRGRSMEETVGHIFERGSLLPCVRCEATGMVARPRKNCGVCGKRGTQQCGECGRWTKHLKKCTKSGSIEEVCPECSGLGSVPRPPRTCPDCKGNCEVPSDPGNIYVSKLLKEGQIALPTYHPAFLMRQPQKKGMVAKHFERLTDLRGELEVDADTNYIIWPTPQDLDKVFSSPIVSIDLETTSLIASQGEIECIGATDTPATGVVAEADSSHAYELLKKAEESDEQLIIGQNWAMFDAYWTYKKWGVGLPIRLFDTLLVSHLLDPDSPKKIAHTVHEYASPPIRGYWKTREHYRNDKRTVALVDVDATLRVARGMEEALEERGLVSEYWNEVYPTMRTAFNMRVGGWRVDRDGLGVAGKRVRTWLGTMRSNLPDWPPTKSTGKRTENQNEQVRSYLYETLRLPVQLDPKEKRPTGGALARKELLIKLKTGSQDTEHLSSVEIGEAVGFIELIDGLKKKSQLLAFLNPESKWLEGEWFHPTWDPAGTATYRFAVREPCVQQVPKCGCKGPNGKKQNCYGTNEACLGARFPFLPDMPTHRMASIDYSQIEVVGFLWSASQWDVLEAVLHKGLDAHEIMGDMLDMDRDEAKNMTFALVYGASDALIAAHSGKSIAEVAVMRQHYLKIFPGVDEFRSYHIHHAMKHGYVENPFGRRRNIWVRNPVGRAANQAANAPIQGIPPMIVRRAMVRLEKELPDGARILGNIHDEIIFSYPEGKESEVLSCAQDVMRSPVPELPAPALGMAGGLILNTDIEVGSNWADLRTWERV